MVVHNAEGQVRNASSPSSLYSVSPMQATEELKRELFQVNHVDEQIASVTWGVLGANLQQDAINKMCAALHSIDEYILEGAATTERGDRAFRTHMQGMFLMVVLDTPDAHVKLREYLIAHMGIRDEGTEYRGTVRPAFSELDQRGFFVFFRTVFFRTVLHCPPCRGIAL